MMVLLHKWEFKKIEVEILKVSENFDHQDFQILELESPGTSWFWQLVQALLYHFKRDLICKQEVTLAVSLIKMIRTTMWVGL